MKLNCFPLFAILLLVSCNSNVVYKQFDADFDDNRWLRADVKNYEFEIEKAAAYDLVINFSHVAGFQFAEIPLSIEITSPDGTVSAQNIMLSTKDAAGNDIGDCAGDYCDLEQVIFKDKTLSAGSYKVKMANVFDHDYLPNVIGVGIKVAASENKK